MKRKKLSRASTNESRALFWFLQTADESKAIKTTNRRPQGENNHRQWKWSVSSTSDMARIKTKEADWSSSEQNIAEDSLAEKFTLHSPSSSSRLSSSWRVFHIDWSLRLIALIWSSPFLELSELMSLCVRDGCWTYLRWLSVSCKAIMGVRWATQNILEW